MCVELAEREEVVEKVKGKSEPLKVAVAGLGTIGEGAALRLLDEAGDYELCAALVRNPSKARPELPGDIVISDNVRAILDSNPDIIIDALPVGDAGLALIEQSLDRGVSIVSANKQAIAGSLAVLSNKAKENNAALYYSAAVGGGSPMVETVVKARATGEITQLTAILNGTVNYILTALAKGDDFETAVKQAQDAGFAEPDPTADLSGDDARAKISILCFEAFGHEIDLETITTEALTQELAEKISADGGVWRQLSHIQRDKAGTVTASLAIEKVPSDSFFAGVTEEGNALLIKTSDGEDFECAGKGAGREPTVASLFSDLSVIKNSLPPVKTR